MSQLPENNGERASTLTEWWEQYGAKQRGNSHRVRAFVRSFAPAPGRHGRQRQLLEGLQSASRRGLIEAYEVTVLGDQLCLCEDCRSLTEAEMLTETVTQLREWEGHGMTANGFSECSVESSVTGDCYDVVVPPEVSFGIYVDSSLAGVFPCADGNRTYQPEAYLDELLDHRPEPASDGTVSHVS